MSASASHRQPAGTGTSASWRLRLHAGLPERARLAFACMCAVFALILPVPVGAGKACAATPTPEQHRKATIDSYTIAQRGDHYRVNITYPLLGIPAADAEITIWAREQAATFIESVQQIPTPMPMPYELTITYETIKASPRATSVIFTISTFMGGLHAEPGLATFVYSSRDGRRLTYGDLFMRMDGILESFSSLCRASLTEKLGDGVDRKMLEQGTAPRMPNFDLFALTSSGLRIFFPPYQAAPFKEGYLYVDIPLKNLTGYQPQLSFWGKVKR